MGYEHLETVIRAGAADDGQVLWTEEDGGWLHRSASQQEAAVIAMIVSSSIDQSSSLLRWLPYI